LTFGEKFDNVDGFFALEVFEKVKAFESIIGEQL